MVDIDHHIYLNIEKVILEGMIEVLELKNICFSRENKKILDNINLKLDNGKFYVITGPNGSGKSTLAKIIMGIEKPDTGKVIFNGKDITNMAIDERAKLGIGFAFQQPIYFKGITVYDLLSIASKTNLTREEACNILSKVGLCALEYVDREINKSLSGGELKRIEIATILAKKPEFAIFDEPEAGIDLWSFKNLIKVFKELHENFESTSLVISHQERILNIADIIILMDSGKITKVTAKDDFVSSVLNVKRCCLGDEFNE